MNQPKPERFLVRHLGNMGDFVFFLPPFLEALKENFPGCHTTLVTSWGYKHIRGRWAKRWRQENWGERNLGGQSLHLIIPNPHVDQLIHYHDTKQSLSGNICFEDGQRFPTWSKRYYEKQKEEGAYTQVFELDIGIEPAGNPLRQLYDYAGLTTEKFTDYKLYLSDSDKRIAAELMADAPHPRIVLLESLAGPATRTWNPEQVSALEEAIFSTYQVKPIWFGGAFVPDYWGRPLSLRENIALLENCDVAVGVLSGPLHFAAAVGLPTLTLFCDQPLHRGAPAYFLNEYIAASNHKHRTLLGPSPQPLTYLKSDEVPAPLTSAEQQRQQYNGWADPGRQATKSCLATISVDEIMTALKEMIPVP